MSGTRFFHGAAGVLACVVAGFALAADKGEPKASPDLSKLSGASHLLYTPDGKSLLVHYHVPPTPSGAAKIGLWDLETGKVRVEMEDPPVHTEAIALSADGAKAAAIGAGDKKVMVWDVGTGKPSQALDLPPWQKFMPGAPFLGFTPDGATLTSAYKQKILRAKVGGEAKTLPNDLDLWSLEMIAYSPAADLLVIASNPPIGQKDDSKLQVYDLNKPGDPQTVPLSGWVRSIALAPDGKTLVVSYERQFVKTMSVPGPVELWDTTAWKVRATLPRDMRKDFWSYRRLFVSPDGKLIVGSPGFGIPSQVQMELVDLDGKILREISSPQQLNDAAFSPDGKTVAVIIGNKPIQFLDAATGKDKE